MPDKAFQLRMTIIPLNGQNHDLPGINHNNIKAISVITRSELTDSINVLCRFGNNLHFYARKVMSMWRYRITRLLSRKYPDLVMPDALAAEGNGITSWTHITAVAGMLTYPG